MLSMSSWRLGLVESMLLDLQRKNTLGKKLIGEFKQPWLHLVWWLRCWIMLDMIETLWFSIQEVYLVLVKNHGTLDPQVDRFEGSEVIPKAATDFVVQRFGGLLIHGAVISLPFGLGFASSFVFFTETLQLESKHKSAHPQLLLKPAQEQEEPRQGGHVPGCTSYWGRAVEPCLVFDGPGMPSAISQFSSSIFHCCWLTNPKDHDLYDWIYFYICDRGKGWYWPLSIQWEL